MKTRAISAVISATFMISSFAGIANANPPATFAPIVEATMPAVVNISTTQSIDSKNALEDLRAEIPEGTPFDHLFKEFLDREFSFPEGRKRKATSLGSGFIISADGLVVTNHHVIEGADVITVTLSNDSDKNYTAKLIGSDKRTDLALLKIESTTALPFLKFGNSDVAKVGDWIIAIGNPFGLGGSVTAGIVSAKSRLISGQYDEFIQTDASINRGNSGGPMINTNGEVIGINSVILSSSGGSVGIGFSIPSNQASSILEQLKKNGKITRGRIGVIIQPISEDIAKNMGIKPDTKGVLVTQLMKDSPAYKAGIKVGDIITAFDGTAVTQPNKLSRTVADTPIGKKSTVDLIRDNKPMKAEVTVDTLTDADAPEHKDKQADTKKSIDSNLGIKFEDLTVTTRNKYQLDKDSKGALITGVSRNSPAGDAGLKAGDVILQVNRSKIESAAQCSKEIEAAKKTGAKNVVLLVQRGAASLFIVIEFD